MLTILRTLLLFGLFVVVSAIPNLLNGDDAPRPQAVEAAQIDPVADATVVSQPPNWHKSLEPALDEARQRKALILVRVGAEWCGWCRKLEREIEKPEVQQELARWVLVELDADEDQTEVRRLNVGPIPALRILDAGGRVVRTRDGFLAAKPLVDWLRRCSEPGAADDRSAAITEVPALSAETLPKLIKLLAHRDPDVRDEVIRRLSADPKLCAAAVASAFREGTLAMRLSALEVLSHWNAPAADLDPWDPQTLTTPRLDELAAWAKAKSE